MAHIVEVKFTKTDSKPWILANASPVALAQGLDAEAQEIADKWWVCWQQFSPWFDKIQTSFYYTDTSEATWSVRFESQPDMQNAFVDYYTDKFRMFAENLYGVLDSYYSFTSKTRTVREV